MNIFPVNHLLDTIFSDSKYYCLTCSEFKEFTNKDSANLPFYVPRYDALNLFIKSRIPFLNLGFTEVLNPFEFGGCFKTRPSLQPAPPQKKHICIHDLHLFGNIGVYSASGWLVGL